MKTGYLAGTWDLFHVGHLRAIKRAKNNCDFLIVAVSTDELVESYKVKKPVIPFEQRWEIVEAITGVDKVVVQDDLDKVEARIKHKFDVCFISTEHMYDELWQFPKLNVQYIPHSTDISSTKIKERIKQ